MGVKLGIRHQAGSPVTDRGQINAYTLLVTTRRRGQGVTIPSIREEPVALSGSFHSGLLITSIRVGQVMSAVAAMQITATLTDCKELPLLHDSFISGIAKAASRNVVNNLMKFLLSAVACLSSPERSTSQPSCVAKDNNSLEPQSARKSITGTGFSNQGNRLRTGCGCGIHTRRPFHTDITLVRCTC